MSSWGCEGRGSREKTLEQAGALVEGPSGDRGKGWKVSLLDVKLGCGARTEGHLENGPLIVWVRGFC